MSNTYRRQKLNKGFDALRASSSDVIDYRAKLCYLSIADKHPKWDRNVVKGLAEWKALFITIFQKPLEIERELLMKRKLRKLARIGKH